MDFFHDLKKNINSSGFLEDQKQILKLYPWEAVVFWSNAIYF